MTDHLRLESYLDCAAARTQHLLPVCSTVHVIAAAGHQIACILARSPLAGNLTAIIGNSLDCDDLKAWAS